MSNSDAAIDQSVRASSGVNQQLQSKIMQLPQEIRDEIYANVFCSTRFAFGERALGRVERCRVVSSARGTALALLRTCRRVRDEVGVTWLHQVLFHFEDPESLLDKLALIPMTLRKQVRHVRVLGGPLMLSCVGYDASYRTAQVLKMLPGLELDTFTVLGDREAQASYDTLNTLVRYSDGWKELHYLSHTSKLLGYKDYTRTLPLSDPTIDQYLRQPQPSDWQKALEQRDGQASHPSVVVYQATEAAAPGAVLQHGRRKTLTQAFTLDQTARTFGKAEDAMLMRSAEVGKELLVVVKRGDGVDYVEKEGSPYLCSGDIRVEFFGMTWKDIKANQHALLKEYDDDDTNDSYSESDDDDDQFDDQIPPPWKPHLENDVIVDSYKNVYDYAWPPLHFSNE